MSWDAVAFIAARWKLSFDEVPVAGYGFYRELAKIRPDWHNKSKWPFPPNDQASEVAASAVIPLNAPVERGEQLRRGKVRWTKT